MRWVLGKRVRVVAATPFWSAAHLDKTVQDCYATGQIASAVAASERRGMEESNRAALIPKAVYRFARTSNIRYYRAERTRSGIEFLYPISVNGSRIVDTSRGGRDYVVLYLLTKWGKLAAGGYWLNPRKIFEKAYVTDATPSDLVLVAEKLEDLPDAHLLLDDVLNRAEVEVDMEVWGSALE